MSLDLGQRFTTAYLEMLAGILERGEPLTHPSPRNIAWALRDIPTLIAEVERLRAALERIAGMRLNFLAQEIAREALEPVEGVPAQEGRDG